MRNLSLLLLTAVLIFVPTATRASLISSQASLLSVTIVGTSTTPSPPPPAPSGGGSISPTTIVSNASVIFTGRAYPNSNVLIFSDGNIISTTPVGADSLFNIRVDTIASGSHLFSIYATDAQGYRSPAVSTGVFVTPGVITTVSSILVAPTITTDKSEVKQGSDLTVSGAATPGGIVTITVNSSKPLSFTAKAAANGTYSSTFSTATLPLGDYTVQSRVAIANDTSGSSNAIGFTVGSHDVARSGQQWIIGDLNHDGHVNIVDFSIEAYWYKRANPPKAYDLNGDGKITLVDFSIMAFHWTG